MFLKQSSVLEYRLILVWGIITNCSLQSEDYLKTSFYLQNYWFFSKILLIQKRVGESKVCRQRCHANAFLVPDYFKSVGWFAFEL